MNFLLILCGEFGCKWTLCLDIVNMKIHMVNMKLHMVNMKLHLVNLNIHMVNEL